jgi:ankyrin repeat protein
MNAFWLKRVFFMFLALGVLGGALYAQNLKDDIANNDLDGLKAKVALLEPDFKGFPYVAYYLKNTKEYQQVMLDYLLAKGANPDQVDDKGVGPLYYAIASDNLEAVTTLITAKAKVNAEWTRPKDVRWSYELNIQKDYVSELPLFDAKEIAFIHGADGKSTLRPLAVALYSGNTDIVPALLKAGADPLGWLYRIQDAKLSTAAKPVYSYTNTIFDHVLGRFTTSGGSLERVSPTFFANAVTVWKAVMALPAARKPVVAPKLSANLFAYFATGAMKEFKAELVKTGANTLAFLPYAALAGNWDIVDLIFKYNTLEIDDNFDDSKQSLLAWSIANLHAGAANLLLEHGAVMPATILAQNEYGKRYDRVPLVWAASQSKPELVKVLIKYKTDPNKGFPIFYTHASPAVRKLLVDAGADFKAIISYGNKEYMAVSLVQDAARDDQPEAIAFWLEQGLDPNGTGSGQPLVAAVVAGNPESVRILLGKGAAPGVIVDSDHIRFYDIPGDFKFKSLVEYARYRVTRVDEPLAKSRANQVVKLIEKALAAAKPGEYKVGAAGPSGGLIFFDKGYVSDGWRYLEAAPVNQSDKIQWYNGKSVDVKTGRGIGSGLKNTEAIATAQGPGEYAASICANLELGGYSDWFLPSMDELDLMYLNLQNIALGGFGGVWFWSSSQGNDGNGIYAWRQNFADGGQDGSYEYYEYAVRACRAF